MTTSEMPRDDATQTQTQSRRSPSIIDDEMNKLPLFTSVHRSDGRTSDRILPTTDGDRINDGEAPDNDARDDAARHRVYGDLSRGLEIEDDLLSGVVPSNEGEDAADGEGDVVVVAAASGEDGGGDDPPSDAPPSRQDDGGESSRATVDTPATAASKTPPDGDDNNSSSNNNSGTNNDRNNDGDGDGVLPSSPTDDGKLIFAVPSEHTGGDEAVATNGDNAKPVPFAPSESLPDPASETTSAKPPAADEILRGDATVVAGANQSISSNGDSTGGGKMNLLLVVGAAGAAFSLLLLVGMLCYAKRSHDAKQKKRTSDGDDVVFQPGKNNPRVKKKKRGGSSGDALEGPPMPPPPPAAFDDEDDDEESHWGTIAAKGTGDEGSAADHTLDGDLSFAFTADEESLAPSRGGSSAGAGADAAIGAGGMTSFANDKGVFRWNDEGTKMVYTPKFVDVEKGGGGGGGDQNGFLFDESKKKWVVRDHIVGEKNVSFRAGGPPSNDDGGSGSAGMSTGGPPSVLRTRSNDSVGTGVTGLTDFSYGEVALDAGPRRSRSNGTERSFGSDPERRLSRDSPETPRTPGTPRDQGVEVTDVGGFLPGNNNSNASASFDEGAFGEFAPDTNMERFMGTADGGDDITAFSDFTGFTGGTFDNSAFDGAPPPTRVVTPERRTTPPRTSTTKCDASVATFGTVSTGGTGNPGRIVPKRRTQGGQSSRMTIAEDTPFDEDIPFDERSQRDSSSQKTGLSSGAATATTSKLVLQRNMLDEEEDDDRSASEGSEGTSNSEQVLEDLDKLSRFMTERKRSSKGQGSRRRRKGGANVGAIDGSGGGRSSFRRGEPARYSDPRRGV